MPRIRIPRTCKRQINLALRYVRRWVPLLVLTIFFLGSLSSLLNEAHADDTLVNAIHIAELQHDVQDLKDMPIQMGSLRERMVKIESAMTVAQKQLDSIDTKGNWLVFGVFGTLLSQFLKGTQFGGGGGGKDRDTESSSSHSLIKA